MRFCRLCFGITLSILAGLSSAAGQVDARVTQQINARQRTAIAGTVPQQIHKATDAGRASGTMSLGDILVRLQPSPAQQAALTAFVADVHNPQSANYHQWLTAEQFGSRFGVADSDLQAVEAWLTGAGLQVTEVSQGRQWVRVSGTVAQAEAAFGTEFHQYRLNGNAEVSINQEISVPTALSPVVAGVVSLSSFRSAAQHSQPRNVSVASDGKLHAEGERGATPAYTNPGSPETNFLAPGDFARIYNTTPLIKQGTDGTGLSIGVLGRSDIFMSDVEAFRKIFGLPFNDPQVIQPNGDPGVLDGDDVESSLDLEWAGAVAPNATIKFISGNSSYSTDGIDIAAAYAVDHRVAPILSLSYGSCEQGIPMSEINFYNQTWAQAAAEGITVLVSAGDAGSSGCTDPSGFPYAVAGLGVNALASTNFNVAVGGTEFLDTNLDSYWNLTERKDQSSVKGYIPEATWNESCNLELPVSLGNCYFQDQSYAGAYAGAGGASNCAQHDSTANLLTGLYTCTAGRPKPDWQRGIGVPNDGLRDLPDVALAAAGGHDGYLICIQGSCQYSQNNDGSITLQTAAVVGGTSASAPSMAGILALAEQRVGAYQGQANYKLYALSASQNSSLDCNSSDESNPGVTSSCIFHDITAGTNALSCPLYVPNCEATPDSTRFGILSGYSATRGYDLTAGLGSVDAANLVAGWAGLATINTTTTVSVNPVKFAHGASVEVTSTVAPAKGSGTPTGEIVYLVSGAMGTNLPVLTSQLTGGIYAGHIDTLPGGTYTLRARYGGDGTYVSSTSSAVSLTVAPENSKLKVTTFAPAPYFILGKQPLLPVSSTGLGTTFFVQVNVVAISGNGTATGSVTLENGSTKLGTYPVDSTGSIYVPCGPYTSCDLARGSYNLTASYSGDNSFNPSTTTFPFTITKGVLNYNEDVSNHTPPANSTVIATVTFNYDPVAIPTGTVRLTRDDTGATLATGTINPKGTAVIPFVAPAGSYGVRPVYSGDANYTPGFVLSYSDITTATAGSSATTTTMTVKSTTTTVGGSTNVSVFVTPNQATSQFPTGSVYLTLIDGAFTTNFPLVHGAVTVNLPWPNAGNYKFEATYPGDSHFAASTSRFATVTVSKGNVGLRIIPQASNLQRVEPTSLTAYFELSAPLSAVTAPTGIVQFYDSVNGSIPKAIGIPANVTAGNGATTILATTSLTLPAGENRITAVYLGDSNWLRSEGGPVQITVR